MSLTAYQQRKWVLEKIVRGFKTYPEIANKARYAIESTTVEPNAPSPNVQRDIIEKILNLYQGIEILETKYSRYEENTSSQPEVNYYELKLLRPAFDEKCAEYGISIEGEEDGTIIQEAPSVPSTAILVYYPDSNDVSYKNITRKIKDGGKVSALLKLLEESKNTYFSIEDIEEYCNPNVNVETHKFHNAKDVYDTVYSLRKKLKVANRASFPIQCEGSGNSKKWGWFVG
jgi:hypothetical protein